jgi:hypothetical protein
LRRGSAGAFSGRVLLIFPKRNSLELVRAVDFAPVGLIGTGAQYLAVNNDLPIRNISELVAYAKSHPGELNYGSPNDRFAHQDQPKVATSDSGKRCEPAKKSAKSAIIALATRWRSDTKKKSRPRGTTFQLHRKINALFGCGDTQTPDSCDWLKGPFQVGRAMP